MLNTIQLANDFNSEARLSSNYVHCFIFFAMNKTCFFYLSLAVAVTDSNRIDYCDPHLCPPPQFSQHTGCNNNGRFSHNCSQNIKVVRLTIPQKQAFVDFHNKFRQQTAMGLTPKNSTVIFFKLFSPTFIEISTTGNYKLRSFCVSDDEACKINKKQLFHRLKIYFQGLG